MGDLSRRLAVTREPDPGKQALRDQRYTERHRHSLGPTCQLTFGWPNDPRREVRPQTAKAGH